MATNKTAIKNMTTAQIRAAIRLGRVNLGAIRNEYRADLMFRIDCLTRELATR